MYRIIYILLITLFSVCVSAQNTKNISIPNVFTPNEDGINDEFKIKLTGAKQIDCKIYNRFGQIMFEIIDINKGWDGKNTIGLQYVYDGVYYYQATVTWVDDSTSNYSGFFMLVK